jgi:autophagy-related protein 9
MVSLSVFLLVWVDWGELIRCGATEADMTCGRRALRSNPVEGFSVFSVVYLAVFVMYWVFEAGRFLGDMVWIGRQRRFYEEVLGVSDHDLQTCKWEHVVVRVIEANKRSRFCKVVEELSAHEIAMRILREENYIIAMFNQQVIHCKVNLPVVGVRPVLTYTLEYALRKCLSSVLLNSAEVRLGTGSLLSINTEDRLQRTFRMWAVGHLLLSPFILVYLFIVRFFFGEVARLYYNPKEAGSRQWTHLAKWTFKEYNELPHVFRERLAASRGPADTYVAQFPSTVASIVSKFVCAVLGALVSTMLFVGLLDDSLLIQTHIWSRNLLWYIGVFAAVIAVARSFRVDDTPVHDPDQCLRAVALHTHYMPHRWRGPGRAANSQVQDEFLSLYRFRVLVFLEEMASVLLTPYMLWFDLPARAAKIVSFIGEFTVNPPGVGAVCSLAVFDFATHGNSKYGAPVNAPKTARSKHGKLEKSYVNFSRQHPGWSGTETGRVFRDKVLGRAAAAGPSAFNPARPSAAVPVHSTGPSPHLAAAASTLLGGAAAAAAAAATPNMGASTMFLATPFANFGLAQDINEIDNLYDRSTLG